MLCPQWVTGSMPPARVVYQAGVSETHVSTLACSPVCTRPVSPQGKAGVCIRTNQETSFKMVDGPCTVYLSVWISYPIHAYSTSRRSWLANESHRQSRWPLSAIK